MPKLNSEEVRKIADLARIELNADEEKRFAETISSVLEYMQVLNEVDTSNVEPALQVTGLKNIVREDEVKVCGYTDKLIKSMPEVEDNELVVPAVFE